MLDPTTVRPIIVQTVDGPAAEELGLGEIILQAVGLTGVILVASLVLGIALACGIVWLRKRQARGRREGEAGDQIRLRLETGAPTAAGQDLDRAVAGGKRA